MARTTYTLEVKREGNKQVRLHVRLQPGGGTTYSLEIKMEGDVSDRSVATTIRREGPRTPWRWRGGDVLDHDCDYQTTERDNVRSGGEGA